MITSCIGIAIFSAYKERNNLINQKLLYLPKLSSELEIYKNGIKELGDENFQLKCKLVEMKKQSGGTSLERFYSKKASTVFV